MTNYFSPTVIQPSIPAVDITPLERLLLSHIFRAVPDGDRLYYSADETPANKLWLDRTPLETALARSPAAGTAAEFVTEQLARVPRDNAEIELHASARFWQSIFQDIVRRSPILRYITAVSSFTCSKMLPDGFGGMAVLITASAVMSKSTVNILEEFFDKAMPGNAVPDLVTGKVPR